MEERPELSAREQASLFTPARAFLWMLGNMLFMVLLSLLLISARPEAEEDIVSLAITSSAGFLLVTALLLTRFPAGPRLALGIALRAVHPLTLLGGLVIGVLAQIPAESLYQVVIQISPPPPGELEQMAERLRPRSLAHAIALVFSLAVLVPISEEIFFRGAVYGALRRGSQSLTISTVVVALGFTLSHVSPRMLLPLGTTAAILGTLRAASGSLFPSILAHMGFNAVTVLSAVLPGAPKEWTLPVGYQIGGSATVLLLLYAYVRFVGMDRRTLLHLQEETAVFNAREESER